ncbi:MAG: Glycosyl transferase, group 1 [Candidatus Gottesmanbacteria bacterium GW2011_GWA2_44_17]|uniref:Glycosyl transferase, group 1 n=3 Tax=Candidatus Gottesmaniibacteriota TaxID=1752720 RepID=A0A0G1LL52_9BACT|nr:MAG: Glycosyl transferase, group 1 [Microgenomates group bacterium GW2011_GWC1_43_11]KKT38739.1 MAG: Glycosyl transferase, group 1 [Candidatus Gottesmanbacteria bacterium GW2011_GWB1_44_11c]KKT47127.1 MAG: Glycosyl transferase, group 1 [Candidatus Gottesmanbacteria bacterium GW2011_GWA2_44_17]KKT60619.1 MAG: Glycosyl transferase, group 1 [Candidatus Gottesmanbacteria bacterium GW2011_GWA1_44_24b]HCM82871.1 hypothetical protein [Patescibacteria group bacterium]
MKIGIDARLINETGVGRYIRNLIGQLKVLDVSNNYVVYLPKILYDDFQLPNMRWEKRLATVRWHTAQEQFVMPLLFLKDNLDLLHVPYFNVPILYPKKYIVTIHDLTILHFMTGKATTLPYPFYALRKFGYRLILELGVRKAIGILVPSHTTKQEIIDHFQIPEKKIHVTYEGVDESMRKWKMENGKWKAIKSPYFLYVGNAYPHKNLEMLILAFADFVQKRSDGSAYRLVLVGKEDFFYKRLKTFVHNHDLHTSVLFLGAAEDETLHTLYRNARALVFPSQMEGFGLPALEALFLGTPVMCSDIPIFREILQNLPVYINPNDKQDMVHGFSVIARSKDKDMAGKRNEITSLLKNYSWEQLGRDTMALYNHAGKHPSNV